MQNIGWQTDILKDVTSTTAKTFNFTNRNNWTVFIEVESWFVWEIKVQLWANSTSFFDVDSNTFTFTWTEVWQDLKALFSLATAVSYINIDVTVTSGTLKYVTIVSN